MSERCGCVPIMKDTSSISASNVEFRFTTASPEGYNSSPNPPFQPYRRRKEVYESG